MVLKLNQDPIINPTIYNNFIFMKSYTLPFYQQCHRLK